MATAEPAEPGTRVDRRRAITRASLVEAGQRLLAEQPRSEVSIAEIAKAADIGFGSFYSYFDSKDELFDEAVRLTLRQHADLMTSVTAGLDDPAEIFAASFRLTGRLIQRRPTMAKVVLRTGLSLLTSEEGLASHAREDIRRAVASGRFVVGGLEAALVLAGGSILGLLQVVSVIGAGPVADELTDTVVRHLLISYGLPPDEASAVVSRPLPAIPVLNP